MTDGCPVCGSYVDLTVVFERTRMVATVRCRSCWWGLRARSQEEYVPVTNGGESDRGV